MAEPRAPFLDPALIVDTLDALKPATVAAVAEIGDPDDPRWSRAMVSSPALLIIPQRTEANGPAGLGNGRFIRETLGILIHLRHAAQDGGATARPIVRDIRAAVFTLLEGLRIDPAWAPLRYLGGQLLPTDDDPSIIYRWIEYYETETSTPPRPR